jgi:hypothetical protein
MERLRSMQCGPATSMMQSIQAVKSSQNHEERQYKPPHTKYTRETVTSRFGNVKIASRIDSHYVKAPKTPGNLGMPAFIGGDSVISAN